MTTTTQGSPDEGGNDKKRRFRRKAKEAKAGARSEKNRVKDAANKLGLKLRRAGQKLRRGSSTALAIPRAGALGVIRTVGWSGVLVSWTARSMLNAVVLTALFGVAMLMALILGVVVIVLAILSGVTFAWGTYVHNTFSWLAGQAPEGQTLPQYIRFRRSMSNRTLKQIGASWQETVDKVLHEPTWPKELNNAAQRHAEFSALRELIARKGEKPATGTTPQGQMDLYQRMESFEGDLENFPFGAYLNDPELVDVLEALRQSATDTNRDAFWAGMKQRLLMHHKDSAMTDEAAFALAWLEFKTQSVPKRFFNIGFTQMSKEIATVAGTS